MVNIIKCSGNFNLTYKSRVQQTISTHKDLRASSVVTEREALKPDCINEITAFPYLRQRRKINH